MGEKVVFALKECNSVCSDSWTTQETLKILQFTDNKATLEGNSTGYKHALMPGKH